MDDCNDVKAAKVGRAAIAMFLGYISGIHGYMSILAEDSEIAQGVCEDLEYAFRGIEEILKASA